MLNRNILAMVGATLALVLGAAAPVSAQTYPDGPPSQPGTTGESTLPARTSAGRTARAERPRQPAAPTPAQNVIAAQAVATAAGSACQVSEATLLGVNAEQQSLYEAACATGPGYILINSTPPQAVDCVILVGQADIDRAKDPAAVIGLQCTLPVNTDVVRVVAAYAAEAGIACTVDQGASIGKSTGNNIIYEIGCAGVDGFWLEKQPTGWLKTECIKVITQSATCKFTTPAEQAASVKAMLVGSEAAGCDVTEARYMGANTNGAFYEAKCGDAGGYIARFNTGMAIQEIYPCADAARIGGGCKLTVVPVAAEPAPAPASATEQ